MANGFKGRKITFEWDDEEILGVREKSIALNGEPVDQTSDDDNGWRSLLAEAGQVNVDISISGVTKSSALKEAWFSVDKTGPATITYPDGGTLTGTFFLVSYTDTGPYNDATTFEAELQSSGEVTYTPAEG